MPGKFGGRAPGKILDKGYALARKVTNLGEEFPKPEHGGLCQLGLEIAVKRRAAKNCHDPRLSPPWFESLGRDRYQVYCGAFTV
jgi:hypothetical protein